MPAAVNARSTEQDQVQSQNQNQGQLRTRTYRASQRSNKPPGQFRGNSYNRQPNHDMYNNGSGRRDRNNHGYSNSNRISSENVASSDVSNTDKEAARNDGGNGGRNKQTWKSYCRDWQDYVLKGQPAGPPGVVDGSVNGYTNGRPPRDGGPSVTTSYSTGDVSHQQLQVVNQSYSTGGMPVDSTGVGVATSENSPSAVGREAATPQTPVNGVSNNETYGRNSSGGFASHNRPGNGFYNNNGSYRGKRNGRFGNQHGGRVNQFKGDRQNYNYQKPQETVTQTPLYPVVPFQYPLPTGFPAEYPPAYADCQLCCNSALMSALQYGVALQQSHLLPYGIPQPAVYDDRSVGPQLVPVFAAPLPGTPTTPDAALVSPPSFFPPVDKPQVPTPTMDNDWNAHSKIADAHLHNHGGGVAVSHDIPPVAFPVQPSGDQAVSAFSGAPNNSPFPEDAHGVVGPPENCFREPSYPNYGAEMGSFVPSLVYYTIPNYGLSQDASTSWAGNH